MLAALRRSRLVPLLLLLALPGAGGTLVQAGHDCAEQAPWAAEAVDAQGHHHQGHGTGSPSESDQPGQPCQCVGACQAPAAPAGPAALPSVATLAVEPALAPTGPAVAAAPRPRPDRLLPPAIAPPLA